MNPPNHHPPEEELLEYAAGTTPEWLSLMLACHLTLCPRCRQEVALLEDLGGSILQLGGGSALPVRPPGLAPSPKVARPRMGPRLPEPLASRVPWPLQQYVRDTEPSWEPLLKGIEHIPLTLAVNDNPVRLLRLTPGHHVSQHEHAGLEWFMVIDGTIDDSLSGNQYYRGDVCRNDSGTAHHQNVGAAEPCIAMVARTAPFIPKPEG